MHRPCLLTTTTLALLHTTFASKVLQPRQSSPNLWHISDSYIGCGVDFCSYQFHVTGQDTGQLPYFDADCTQQVGIGDTGFRQCNLVGAGSQTGKTVDGVYAFVALYPRNRLQSQLVVQLQFTDARQGSREFWQAEQNGTYQTFSQDLSDFDVLPLQAAAVA